MALSDLSPCVSELLYHPERTGLAMINCVLVGYEKKVLTAKNIVELAKKGNE